jgi:hypothetical protein
VAVLAGGLAFVGTAEATELITDGSFENTKATSSPIVKYGGVANPGLGGGWSSFSTYLYSTLYTMPGPAGSGQQYLRPYPSGDHGIPQSSAVVTQLVSLTATTSLTPAKIDAGSGKYTMSAWFSSYLMQGDFSDLTLKFLNATNGVVGDPIPLGGTDFVSNIPTESNAKYGNAKDWVQDLRTDTIPAGARFALVTVAAGSPSVGSPDGYVDLVSLDVVDAALSTPTVASANPGDKAVNVGPVVNLEVTLQDRSTAVNTNSIQLILDNAPVSPSSIQKTDTNTIVQFAAGLLPPLSSHAYKIIFSDLGTPVTTQTNEFKFTVADYLTLPAAMQTPLASEDNSKPGFNVTVYQVDTISGDDVTTDTQINLPASISFSESVLAGLAGPNIADLSAAEQGNTFAVPDIIDWVNATGASANFPNDQPFPGAIPGPRGTEDSFVDDIRTFIRFPSAGFYQMGINNQAQFRLTAATNGYETLQIVAPTNFFIPTVAIATNITQLQFGGALPRTPLTAPVAYATPSGNPEDACLLGVNANAGLSGKIVLLDRGGTNCNSAFKAEQAQIAGAVAIIEITPGDPGFPFRIDDINTNVHIPVLVIAENFGGSRLKSYLTNGTPVTATIQGDPNLVLAEWDGPKGFGAVDVTFGFAVPAAGLYPLRLVAGQESGPANLEWFSINPDGTRILINDTNSPNALLAFRARSNTSPATASFNVPTISAGKVNISWTGSGTLEEATSITGPWNSSANQANPQSVSATGAWKFYRIRQ